MVLTKDATLDQASKHLTSFLALVNEYADIADTPLPDDMVCSTFLGSLTGHLGTSMRTLAGNGQVKYNWAELQRTFNQHVDAEKMAMEREKNFKKRDKGNNIAAISEHRASSYKSGDKDKKQKKPVKKERDSTDQEDDRCNYCNYRNHTESECRRKRDGFPSFKEIEEFRTTKKRDKAIKSEASSKPGNTAAVAALSATDEIFLLDTAAVYAVDDDKTDTDSEGGDPSTKAIIDTGATHHLFGNKSLLDGLKELEHRKSFRLANTKHRLLATHTGQLTLTTNGIEDTISDILFSTETTGNLLSWSRLRDAGWTMDSDATFLTKEGLAIPLDTDLGGRPCFEILEHVDGTLAALDAAHTPSELHTIHKRLGHQGRSTILNTLRSGLIDGLDASDAERLEKDPFKLTDCEPCLEARALRYGAPGTSQRGNADGDIVHFDIKGPLTTSVNKNKYWLATLRDYTNLRLGFSLADKKPGSILRIVKLVITMVKRQTNVPVKAVRTDGGTEFVNEEVNKYFEDEGIIHQVAAPYIHQHNGAIEALNNLLSTLVRIAMRSCPSLPAMYWEYTLQHVNVNLLMTSPSMGGSKTAWEVWTSRKPDYMTMRKFGEVAFATLHNPQDRLKANVGAARAVKVRLLHRSMMQSAWVVYVEHDATIALARDIKFPTISDPATSIPKVPFGQHGPRGHTSTIPAVRGTAPATAGAVALEDDEEREYVHLSALELAAADEAHIMLDHPATIAEALAGQDGAHFAEAMQVELDALDSKGTWSEAVLPRGRKMLSTKWVPTRKYNADGIITRFKARLVGRGFSQTPGIDFNETYSPVARTASLRLLCAIAAREELHLHQADVEGAYLNAPLEEEIYISPPLGYTMKCKSKNTLRLNRALYGLKQSGRAWWLELSRVFGLLGYRRTHSDWGVYTRTDEASGKRIYILVYVDDLLIACDTVETARTALKLLNEHWVVTDLGAAHTILGMVLERDLENHTISISQTGYIDKLMARFNILNPRAGRTAPLPTGEQPAVAEEAIDQRKYQELVGSVLWLAGCTRPDVSFAASLLGHHSHSPGESIWEIGKRVLAYLSHTRYKKLTLGAITDAGTAGLVAFSDSDWAACPTGRSTSGWIVCYANAAVNWSSKRQGTTAASTMEAEYYAAAAATHEVLWLRGFLDKLGKTVNNAPTTLYLDNQAALRLASNPHSHARAKHINVKYHITRDEVEKGTISVNYIKTGEQPADILTKALPGPRHGEVARKIGLRNKSDAE